MGNQHATRTELDRQTDGEPLRVSKRQSSSSELKHLPRKVTSVKRGAKGGLMDAIEITPPLERLTSEAQLMGCLWWDVFRMCVPGGWLVTTVVQAQTAPDEGGLAQSTVFVADPEGNWLCTGKDSGNGG